MAYWILLALYLMLVLLYAHHAQKPTVPAWPLLPKEDTSPSATTSCQTSQDCAPYQVCLHQVCVPQLLRGEECYPETGDWTRVSHRGQTFAACICKNPQVVTQRYFGSNCDQDVACRPYGFYNWHTNECSCQEGFKAEGFKCISLLAKDRMLKEPCESKEVLYKDLGGNHGFTPEYLQTNADKKCFKRPCTFDAYSGQFLKRARYEEGKGCVCDPSLGQFGVRLEGLDSYTQDEGYNACVSIFKTPLEEPQFVQIFAYFYLLHRKPVVFIRFSNLITSRIIEPLQAAVKQGTLQMGQEFPYDYLQAHLRKRDPFLTLTRQIVYGAFHSPTFRKPQKTPNGMQWCRFMSRHLNMNNHLYEWNYNLLNQFPMCYIGKTDPQAPEAYRGHYVLNPLQLTYKDQTLERTNAVVFTFEDGQWVLSLTEGYDVDTYLLGADTSFIPDIMDDPVVEMLQTGGKVYRDAFDQVNRNYYNTHADRVAKNEPIFQN